jgi:hypothetical protein
MLLIRHAIGSRLFLQTEGYQVEEQNGIWNITVDVDEEKAAQIVAFRQELNFFVVGAHEKTWYYSSDGEITYSADQKQLLILADHKTVYPTS